MIGEIAVALLLGVGAGVLAGLFGVGGGILFVPTLTLILGLSQVVAEGTSLLAIIPVAVVGSYRNTSAGLVRWGDAAAMGLFSVATGVAGAVIADAAPERALRLGFAAVLVATAAQLIWRNRRPG
ncbi:MAG: sulfite exporter TauE/SafE family protein [Actinomycetota bacterium]